MTTLGQRPSPREKSLLGRGESPPRHNVAEDGGGKLPPVVTLPSSHGAGKVLKQKRTMKVLKGKAVIITFGALCLTRPYLSVLTTTPNNWKEGLMVQVPTLGASFRRKETTIKREVK